MPPRGLAGSEVGAARTQDSLTWVVEGAGGQPGQVEWASGSPRTRPPCWVRRTRGRQGALPGPPDPPLGEGGHMG